ncbi:MAG: hypothetical protein AB8I08_36575 [Sandaracinaceae bacterium]
MLRRLSLSVLVLGLSACGGAAESEDTTSTTVTTSSGGEATARPPAE